jgi:hypothetical protein
LRNIGGINFGEREVEPGRIEQALPTPIFRHKIIKELD